MTAQNTPERQDDTDDSLGNLPEWNLNDLYPGPESEAFGTDLARAEEVSKAFAEKWRGKLAETAETGGESLVEAVKEYEALSDLLGRIGAFAMLHYVGDTTDPERGKFYGDVQQKLTDISTGLLFFELEFNKIDDAVMAEALEVPALAHYRFADALSRAGDTRAARQQVLRALETAPLYEDALELLLHSRARLEAPAPAGAVGIDATGTEGG